MTDTHTTQEREQWRTMPFPAALPTKNTETVTEATFVEYYNRQFTYDLKKFYNITQDFGDRSYPFVLGMTKSYNPERQDIDWKDINHYYMFSVGVYFMSMCTQCVGKLFGWHQMENFMRASGWPMLSCGMGGLMSPIQVVIESELYPVPGSEAKYHEVFHAAEDYLTRSFLEFLSGNTANINAIAYDSLCAEANANAAAEEVAEQTKRFECWIDDPSTTFPSLYITHPNTKDAYHDIDSYLNQFQEEMPAWLRNYTEGAKVTFDEVMEGHIGYYPGSGHDGHLLEVGNRSQSVHSFLYVDYLLKKESLLKELAKPRCIKGYHPIGRIDWSKKDILPNGPYPSDIDGRPLDLLSRHLFPLEGEFYCCTFILQRDNNDSSQGDERFAITFLYADGIATYYQLFCKQYRKAPWLLLLQDHGFGGNYNSFGKGGLLDAIITQSDIRPPFVLNDNKIWDGYERIQNLPPSYVRMHHNARYLYRNIR